jgi:hypothetical protein
MIQSERAPAGHWPDYLKAMSADVLTAWHASRLLENFRWSSAMFWNRKRQARFEEPQARSLILHEEKCNE